MPRPFSLLAKALGGGADGLDSVAFAPGSAQLPPSQEAALAKLANALLDRPNLTLTVVGHASLSAERTAYQRERLNAQLRAEAQRQQPASPAPVAVAMAPATPVVAAVEATPPNTTNANLPAAATHPPTADRQRWLAALYRRSDMPKPRNALGLAKDLPPDDMEALLLAQIPATSAAMHALAVQRAVAVRQALLRLKVPEDRLFQGAPTTPAAATDAAWQPRAALELAVK